MLEKQSTIVKQRETRKKAARLIETQWILYQERNRLKDVRKYLWSLPYECRLLYFKFQQVKQDADNLKNDVDTLIAKKKGKVKD
jgi:NAD(P)H-nitrite reductase large subunit